MKVSGFLALVVVGIAALVPASDLSAQTKPIYAGYKGVMIGMPMAEARTKLGDPRDKSDTEDYYVFSESETAQILYDAKKTVRVISVNYIGSSKAPNPLDILGIQIEQKPDGSMNKLVKYPREGFWISYLRTGGDDPMTVVTVQKMIGDQ
jgi:hypothetical protein